MHYHNVHTVTTQNHYVCRVLVGRQGSSTEYLSTYVNVTLY